VARRVADFCKRATVVRVWVENIGDADNGIHVMKINVALSGFGQHWHGPDVYKALRSANLASYLDGGVSIPLRTDWLVPEIAGLKTTAEGLAGCCCPMLARDAILLRSMPRQPYVHHEHARRRREHGVAVIDLTPAAVGPYCVPPVNLEEQVGQREMNVNMVSCGGQATIPMVAAVSRVQARGIRRDCWATGRVAERRTRNAQ